MDVYVNRIMYLLDLLEVYHSKMLLAMLVKLLGEKYFFVTFCQLLAYKLM